MWNCEHCPCMNIAPSVPFCPMCFTPRDVAAESGQLPEGSDGSPVGSTTSELEPPPSGENSGAAPPSPKQGKNSDPDWGKE